MRYEPALQSTLDFVASDYCHFDLDDQEVEHLTRELVNTVLSDRVMSPQAVAAHANKLFSKSEEHKMQHSRLVPPRQPSNESLDTKIREAMQELDEHWHRETVYAFIAPIREKILTCGERVYFTPEGLKRFLDEANIPEKGSIRSARLAGWAASLYQRSDAYDGLVLKMFRAEGHPDPESAEAWRGIINVLGKEQNWALGANGESQKSSNEAKRLIQSITQGRDQFQIFCKDPNRPGDVFRVQTFDSASLKDLSLEKLRELDKAANDLRRRQKLSPDDQRDELREQADKARGHAIYREGDRTELDGTVQYREGPGARYQFVGAHSEAKPSVNPKMDRSVLIPANLAPTIVQLFTDPSTGVLYTKTALHGLATANRALFRKMMSTHVTFMNELLKQDN